MLNLRRLHYFVTVADELHFGRAAERLGIAQPPLSQQIQKLESELGATLFDRSRRAVALTEAGSALLPEAERLLAMACNVGKIPRRIEAGDAGRLRLGFIGSTAFRLLPQLLRHYRAEVPDVELELRELPTAEQIDHLENGTLDAGLVRAPVLRDSVDTAVIWSESLVVALPSRHRLAEWEAIDPAELRDERFVMFPARHGPGLYDTIVGLCEAHGFVPKIAQEAVQMQTIVGLVGAGFGIAIVPGAVQDLRLSSVVYRPILGSPPTSAIALVWNPDAPSATRGRFLAIASGRNLPEYDRASG